MKTAVKLFFYFSIVFLSSSVFSQNEVLEDQKKVFFDDFAKKLESPDYQMQSFSEKSFNAAKKIIIFPEDVDMEKIILSHPEDILFLTTPPHFIHKHVLACTYIHNNDIRLTYDLINDDFLFHTKESVREKRFLAEEDPYLVYELDYFGVREKKRDPDAEEDCVGFVMFEMSTTLYPSFKREGDGKYYVEIASGSRDNRVTGSGNHNWLRLIDADGNVYSVGFHPKYSWSYKNAFARIPGRFYNSDVYEWIDNRTYYFHTFPLHPKEFFALKEDIVNDMTAITNKDTSFDYSILEYSCVDWIVDKLSDIFVLNTDEMRIDMFAAQFPDWFEYYRYEASDEMKKFLDPMLTCLQWAGQIPRYIMAALCGGYDINEENENSVSFMDKSGRLFDININVGYHPFLFEKYFQEHEKELMQQRLEKIEKIEAEESGISNY